MSSLSSQNMPKVKGYNRISTPLMNDYSRDQLRNYMQQISPHTTGAINQLGQQASGQGGEEYRKAAISRYQQEDLPSILQQFAAHGSGKSSGMQNALASSAQGLGQNLAARREDMQSQAIQQLLGLNSDFMNMRDYEHGFVEKPESGISKFMTKGLPAIADIIGAIYGIPNIGKTGKAGYDALFGKSGGGIVQGAGNSTASQYSGARYGMDAQRYPFMPQSSVRFGADR